MSTNSFSITFRRQGKTLTEKFEHLRGYARSRLSVLRDAVALAEAVVR